MKKEYIIRELELQYSRLGELMESLNTSEANSPERRECLKEASYLAERMDENFVMLLDKDRYETIKTGFKGVKWGKRS